VRSGPGSNGTGGVKGLDGPGRAPKHRHPLTDGHTRVYHGSLAELPRGYISRELLCLRATTDYWVNALDGAPLFCVTKPIDPGLQQTLERDIVPRLLIELPGQPSDEQPSTQPHLHPMHDTIVERLCTELSET
jgi:hypothetical protein